MAEDDKPSWFADGDAYETYMGRWSRSVASLFLDWLELPPGLRWADIGCGTGALTAILLDKAEPSRVVGVEPAEGFVAVARDAIRDACAEFKLGDAQELPMEDGEADVAVSGLALNFVPNKVRALKEMRRVVTPGGTVAAYVWDYSIGMQFLRYFYDAVGELFPEVPKNDQSAVTEICRPEVLSDLFRGAGFGDVETRALDAPTVFSEFDDYWSPFLKGQGPAGAQCAALAEHERMRLKEQLARTVPIENDGTIRLTARAWAVRGTR